MKLFRLLFAAMALLVCGMAAQAQTAADVEKTNKKMMAASTPCNGGPEAFRDFIARFSTDADFMNSRVALTAAQKEKYADLLVPDNFTAKVPFEKDGDMFYQSWGELQYNKAYLECGWVDSYYEHTFEFTRRDGGLWYLSKVVAEE